MGKLKFYLQKKVGLILIPLLLVVHSLQMSFSAQCNDGVDNDVDGLIDSSDPGCSNAQDNFERDLVGSDGWSHFTPSPLDTSIYSATHLQQPGSRIFYISANGDDETGEIYFWNGSAIVDSEGSLAGAGGVPYGSDPTNPSGPIRPFRSWAHVAPRTYKNDFQCNGEIGSPWDGSNNGGIPGGLSPCTRAGYPDWWLFKRGESFDLYQDFFSFAQQSNPGVTNLAGGSLAVSGGRSTTEMQLVSAYGNDSLPRPSFTNPIGSFISRRGEPDPKHIAYQSLHFDGRGGTRRGGGTNFEYQGPAAINNLIEDVWFDALTGNVVQNSSIQITFRRCVVTDFWSGNGSHMQGLFWSGRPDAVLRLEECIFMRNGMSHGDPEVTGWPPSLANGQYWDIFNRNFYLSGESRNMSTGIFDTISMIGASGDQSRAGMRMENNFFYQGYLAQGAHGGYPDSHGPTGTMKNNVFQRFLGEGTEDNRGQPGWGLQLGSGASDVEVSGNIVTNAQDNGHYAFALSGSVGWPCYNSVFHYTTRNNLVFNNIFDSGNAPAGIDIEDGMHPEDLACSGWQYPGLTNNTISNNTVINSNRVLSRYQPLESAVGTTEDTVFSNNTVYATRAEAAAALGWPDPNRSLKTYAQFLGLNVTTDDGFLEFFDEAKQQRKGFWRPEYTAQAINTYIRAGFGIGDTPPPPPPNQRPHVNAGQDQSLSWPVNSLTLNGIVTDDGLPNPPGQITVLWSKVSGPGNVDFIDATNRNTVVNFSQAGIYSLQLTANDGGLTSSDNIRITILSSSDSTQLSRPGNRVVVCNDPRKTDRKTTPCLGFANVATQQVEISVFDVSGQQVRHFPKEEKTAGEHQIIWDGKNDFGDLVASGIYVVEIKIGEEVVKTKVPIIR